MKIVVDTSVIIAVLTNEPSKRKIIKVTEGHSICAPSSLHWEIGNAFSAMLKRRRINIEQIKKALLIYSFIPIQFEEVDLMNALEIADKFNIYAYDAYFLECAKSKNYPIISLDEKLIYVAKMMEIQTIEV